MYVLTPEGQALHLANLAAIFRDNGRDDVAEYMYRRSLIVMETAAGHSGLGVFVPSCDALSPSQMRGHSILHRTQKLQEAAGHYISALHLNMIMPECHSNLGIALRELGDLQVGWKYSFPVTL